MTIVIKPPPRSRPFRSCATRPTITRCLSATAITRFSRRDMSTGGASQRLRSVNLSGVASGGLRSAAGMRRSLCRRAVTRRPISSTSRCIICRCSNKRSGRSIKQHLWTIGGLRRAFTGCGGSWKPGWAAGRREFIQVLRLMEDFHQHQVEEAVSEALRLGAISFDAVKMLLLAKLENRPARLDLTFYPYLPAATVGTPDPRAYRALLAGSGFISLAAGAQA